MNKSLLKLCILFLSCTSAYSQNTSNTKYFRHLQYNHVSPYVDIQGIHPIEKSEAQSSSHYIFKYNDDDNLIEIINNHYHTERRHPLASLGVYRLAVQYIGNEEIRTFYDPNGLRITNDRSVYQEKYSFNVEGKKESLAFYDLDGKPMESNWSISKYTWQQHKDIVIEKRFNLEGQAVNLSPYFEFGITGIKLNKDGSPNAHYNLDSTYQIRNNSLGIASYKDKYDSIGNHIVYSYHNEMDEFVINQWGFAVGKKDYDSRGNQSLLSHYGKEEELIRERPVYSNSQIKESDIASSSDSSEIRRIALGYLVALQKLDPILMDEVLNDSLNKVTIGFDRATKTQIARPTTRDQMIAFAKDWNKSNMKFPFHPDNKVTILSIHNRMASVKLVSDNWVEYLHLIKLNGKWEIIHLIWQHKDASRYSH